MNDEKVPVVDNDDADIWGPVRDIDHDKLIRVALQHGPRQVVAVDGTLADREARYVCSMQGSNNYVSIIEFANDRDCRKVAIRIPASGWSSK